MQHEKNDDLVNLSWDQPQGISPRFPLREPDANAWRLIQLTLICRFDKALDGFFCLEAKEKPGRKRRHQSF